MRKSEMIKREEPMNEAARKAIEKLDPLKIQVGGDHYKNFPIQPIEYSTKNKLGFIQGCVIKRITRYNMPGGKGLQDLLKIIHEIQVLIKVEGWEEES